MEAPPLQLHSHLSAVYFIYDADCPLFSEGNNIDLAMLMLHMKVQLWLSFWDNSN